MKTHKCRVLYSGKKMMKARPKFKKMQKLMRVRKLDHKVRKCIKTVIVVTDIKNSAYISLRS